MVGERGEADAPVLVAVRAHRGQAAGLGAGGQLGGARALGESADDEAGDDDRPARERDPAEPRGAGQGVVVRVARRDPAAQRGGRRGDRDQQDEGDRAVALAVRERAGERRDPAERRGGERAGDGRAEGERGGPELGARPRRGDEHHEAEGGDRDRPARERQVDAGAERDGRGGGEHPHPGRPGAVAGHARAQHEADRRERALGVPVGDRLLQPAAGARRAGEVDHAGQQPAGEPVADDEGRPGRERGLERAQRPAVAQHADREHQRAGVEHQALDRGERRRAERRPGERDRRPGGQRGEPAEREPPGERARQRRRPGQRERQHERPDDDRGDQARLRVEAAGEEREDGRAEEQARRRDGGHGTTHGAAG